MSLIELLQTRISALAARQRRLVLWCKLASCWAGAGLLGLGLAVLQRQGDWRSPWILPAVLFAALLSSALVLIRMARQARSGGNLRELAGQIEACHPELQGRLLTAVQQAPSGGQTLNFLQERLLLETLKYAEEQNWTAIIPRQRLIFAQVAHWLAVALFAIVVFELRSTTSGPVLAGWFGSSVTVTPGDTVVEKGSSLVVLTRFKGPLPATVTLVVDPAAETTRIPLVKSLADPVFGGSIQEVFSNFSYRVEYGGQATRTYKVTVFEYPRLERSDVALSFPAYTGEQPRRIENTRRVSAVEGSALDLALVFNKPVASATLVGRDKAHRAIPLQLATNQSLANLKGFLLQTNQSYDLQLRDFEGRTNKVSAQFVLEALSNRPPEIKLVSPRNDLRPSALEEISFEGTVWDDFGVQAYGLGYIVAGQPAQFIQVGKTVPAKQKHPFQHLLRLEDLQVQADELISWFLWADDLGPDGAVRRTTGDLFFAEIRPFEEVFREGQGMDGQGQGGQQSGGNQTARLADLQKQIISATWNLQRKQSPASTQTPDHTNQVPSRRESRNAVKTSNAVAAGVSPAVEPGILPGGARHQYTSFTGIVNSHGTALRLDPASETLPSTSGETPAATTSGETPAATASGGRPAATTAARFVAQVAPSGESPESAPGSRRMRPRSAGENGAGDSDDIQVVLEAQSEALSQAKTAAERAQDARFISLWNAATKEMANALARLREATNSPASLKQALAAEQAAYQALLKLQEHEYQVRRSRSRSQGGNGREQQMQRQLEEMELTQSENRYENQRQAQAPQSAQRGEQLQIMNRLQELARRQKDLNERLKELQTALQEATTAEEKAELQRRLKRLQEEEQQMLADVDELRQRMDRPENQSRMADERRQLDQTREDIQRAADAAAQGTAAQALAAGTRAERQLQQLRDQLRKENSSQFAEDLRSMRSQARELARQQQEIQKALDGESSAEHKSLSDASEHKEVLEQLSRQKMLVTNLVERATQVSQQAETSEPLLSSQLYDTVRKFSQNSAKDVQETQEELLNRGLLSRDLYEQLKDESEPDGSKLLDITSDMVRRDFLPQASRAGQRAGGHIDELKRGVERAAESVLGDDTEALRLAEQQLDQLAEQLKREISQAEGNASETNPAPATAVQRSQQGQSNQPQNGGGQLASNSRQNQQNDNDQQASSGQGQGASRAQRLDTGESQDGQNAGQLPGSNGRRAGSSAESASPSSGVRNRADTDSNFGGGGGGPWNFDRILNDEGWRRSGPITGEGYANWSDRLREIEEIVELPDLRNEVATARERARLLRQDYKRDRKKPDWAVVRLQVLNPLAEVRQRIAEELARRQSTDNLVPIDRDPVPARYSDLVRRYYEELGKEK